jgi:hypothetical protein
VHVEAMVDRVVLQLGHVSGDINDSHGHQAIGAG